MEKGLFQCSGVAVSMIGRCYTDKKGIQKRTVTFSTGYSSFNLNLEESYYQGLKLVPFAQLYDLELNYGVYEGSGYFVPVDIRPHK